MKKYLIVLAATVLLLGIVSSAQAQTGPGANLEQRVSELEAALAALETGQGGLAELGAKVAALETSNTALSAKIAALETENTALKVRVKLLEDSSVMDLAPFVSVDTRELQGVAGPHVLFTGANVHVRNGLKAGRGNLIVGYNEMPSGAASRFGLHNLVIGDGHSFSGSGGMVAGISNTITGSGASVTGGYKNTATGISSVSGGRNNNASGYYSSVSGGDSGTATGYASSVSGGVGQTAPATFGWAAGSLIYP